MRRHRSTRTQYLRETVLIETYVLTQYVYLFVLWFGNTRVHYKYVSKTLPRCVFEARHQLLKANAATLDATERGVVQISFSCIHAWLRVAAAEILPAETMTRATPFNRLQGPGRMG